MTTSATPVCRLEIAHKAIEKLVQEEQLRDPDVYDMEYRVLFATSDRCFFASIDWATSTVAGPYVIHYEVDGTPSLGWFGSGKLLGPFLYDCYHTNGAWVLTDADA